MNVIGCVHEKRVARSNQVRQACSGVDRQADDLLDDRALRKSLVPAFEAEVRHAVAQQLPGIIPVQDGKGGVIADESPLLLRMRLATWWKVPPHSLAILSLIRLSTRPSISLAALLVKVSSRMASGRGAGFHEAGHAVGQGPGFAAAGPRNDQERALIAHHHFQLLIIELTAIVDLKGLVCRRRGGRVLLHKVSGYTATEC